MLTEESTHTSMIVEFEASLQDFVKVHLHILQRAGKANQWKWGNAIGLAIGVFASFVFLSQILDFNLLIPILISIAVGSGALAFGDYFLKSRTRRLLEKVVDEDPTLVIIGMRESGLFYKQLGTFVEMEWRKVESLEETDEEIFFELVSENSVSIPKRAFDSEAECEEFIVRGAEYINSVEELYS